MLGVASMDVAALPATFGVPLGIATGVLLLLRRRPAGDLLAAMMPVNGVCMGPIAHTRAYYFLGKAREAKGDKARACAAYGMVRDRWGSAKPPAGLAERAPPHSPR